YFSKGNPRLHLTGVLGGFENDSDPLPDQAVTMAQYFHQAGYQTAVFTSNVYAGTMSSLDRGVDVLREAGTEPNSASSRELHANFWQWREAYPAEPYWVHFQTTDVHWPWKPVAPFAGLYVGPERRQRYYEWERRLGEARGFSGPTWPAPRISPEIFEKIGIDRQAFYSAGRDLYDETMMHNDYQLGRLVQRLKATGEWPHTLLIVAADHGTSYSAGLLEPMPARWGASYYSYAQRIPMIIVWPERIAAGQRFSGPVSMIDMLPTILELTGLSVPEILQGRSLAPVLLGQEDWEPRPVILEELYIDGKTGELGGQIEMIDGRWVASLGVNLPSQGEEIPLERRRPPMLLFDLWNDPHYGGTVHEKHPDLVQKYTKLLQAQWQAHRALAQQFTRSADSPLTPEQLRTLRSLGYIR
ncbi:MAG: sulfatase, partial [Acidobacteriota bacterium]